MSGRQHWRVGDRAAWDALVAAAGKVTAAGWQAAIWGQGERWGVRLVAGCEALRPDRGWVLLYAVPGDPASAAVLSDAAWERYEGERIRWERVAGRVMHPDHPRQALAALADEVVVVDDGPAAESPARARRKDAGKPRGPRFRHGLGPAIGQPQAPDEEGDA